MNLGQVGDISQHGRDRVPIQLWRKAVLGCAAARGCTGFESACKMADGFQVEAEFLIHRSPDAVFSWLLKENRLCEWTEGVIEFEWTQPGPIEVGSTYHQVFQLGGRLTSSDGEVIEYDPPHRVVSVSESRSVFSRNEVTLAPDAKGTNLRLVHAVTVRGRLAKLMFPVMQVATKRRIVRTFERLKQLIEASETRTQQRDA